MFKRTTYKHIDRLNIYIHNKKKRRKKDLTRPSSWTGFYRNWHVLTCCNLIGFLNDASTVIGRRQCLFLYSSVGTWCHLMTTFALLDIQTQTKQMIWLLIHDPLCFSFCVFRFLAFWTWFCGQVTAGSFTKRRPSTRSPTPRPACRREAPPGPRRKSVQHNPPWMATYALSTRS